jgi:hypothetical protein
MANVVKMMRQRREEEIRDFSAQVRAHPSFLASSPFFHDARDASRKLETELTA